MATSDQKNPQYESALSWWESGEYEYAITLMKDVRESGFVGDSASTIGGWLHQLGKTEEAKLYFQIALEDGDETAAAGLGSINFELGQIDEAEKYFRLAIHSDYNKGSLAVLADFLKEKDSPESRLEAEILLRVLFQELDSDNPFSLGAWAGFNLGVLLHERQAYKEAEALYRELLISGYGPAYLNLGCLLHELGNCGAGDSLWLDLLREAEGEVNAYVTQLASDNLELCLKSQGRKEESSRYSSTNSMGSVSGQKVRHITRTAYENPWDLGLRIS